jgi:hypothetical protein
VSIDALDCFNNNCIEELVIIGFQYGLQTKSSTSCVIVVIQRLYFLALFTSQKRNFAESSCCIMFQASSITRNLFLLFDLTLFQIWFKITYIAIGLKISSKSLTENTCNHSFKSIFVFCENIQLKIQVVNFSKRLTILIAQSIVSSTSCKSFIIGISFPVISSSSRVIHFRLYVVISAFSIIEASSGVNFQSIKFISQSKSITAFLSKSQGFSSWSFKAKGKSKGLIL